MSEIVCIKCNAGIPDNDFCTYCGANQRQPSPSKKREDWEDTIDELSVGFSEGKNNLKMILWTTPSLKAFISDLLAKEEKRVKREMVEGIEKWADKEIEIRLSEAMRDNDDMKSMSAGYARGVISRMLKEIES